LSPARRQVHRCRDRRAGGQLPDGAAAVPPQQSPAPHVEAALGGLTLLSPIRRSGLRQRNRCSNARRDHVAVIDGALQKETNKGAKLAFTEAARRSCCFKRTPPTSKNSKPSPHQGARRPGSDGAADRADRRPVPASPRAANATSAIQSRLALWSTVQNAWYGLSLGFGCCCRGDRLASPSA